MIMAISKLPLSILRTEYETPAVGEWVTSRQADVEGGTEASHTTSEGARSAAVAYIGRMDLVIEGCSEDPLAQGAAVAGPYAPPGWARHNLRHGVSILQREGRSALSYAEVAACSTGWVWWIGFRAGLD
jgi:hypothetical protein